MKVMVIGSGGREHALAWKFAQSSQVDEVLCVPGNGGTARMEKARNLSLLTFEEMVAKAEEEGVGLVMVGPETPLVEGVADRFQKVGIPVIGPPASSARLEGSKAFAKEFMRRYGVATADYLITDSLPEALGFAQRSDYPLVIKADGLAAGKGVTIVQSREEAERILRAYMEERIFGEAGTTVVLEEFLEGVEASILSITDGTTIIPFLSAKDHKPIGEGNTGPNTGGMGVIAPNPAVTEEIFEDFKRSVMHPTLEGIQKEGWDFRGIIFFGLMITSKGVKLLEYNVRFGDPETQALLPMLTTDLVDLSLACWERALTHVRLSWEAACSCCVVAASGGYPGPYEKGYPIHGLDHVEHTVFIAGAEEREGVLYTSGGRVLAVTATGATLGEAREKAYRDMEKISFTGMYYRKDIGI
ncbi:phosphoribosylamine--glycine ligase [Spirochaeta thermophila]|uniref:Phosphoribosylamine--glycine ligase n=1 Tax=Winmispira thermophila (strain ATCC 49972 / DSM 6192 / RI 19.B1) TaxID=665571 RepID=E0RTG6_WINT6|nr:phosphoribosylamine--glycine ligase [Spirochaeta thermophila]ADN02197.1 phosphoribosylamine--glycine ligase [Spirochaeta thermophila DSM 6192]